MKKARKLSRKYLRGNHYRPSYESSIRMMVRIIARRNGVPYEAVEYDARTGNYLIHFN
jgi:hypothetical protein